VIEGGKDTLFIHALLYGVFVVGFGGVVEGAAEACRCHDVVCALYLVGGVGDWFKWKELGVL
jgi:hypothetical protein